MRLPAAWDVRSRVYADVTGDGSKECVLSVWRPWRDWPIARWSVHRWSGQATPIAQNRDAQGFSSHVAVVKPLLDGSFRNVWVGSALFQPVTSLTALPDGTLVTLETTYARGRNSSSVALSEWRWTGFGFGLQRRRAVEARQVSLDSTGQLVVR